MPGSLEARSDGARTSALPRAASALLQEAKERERAGNIAEAAHGFEATIAAAERSRERPVQAEALRRLGVLKFQRDDASAARELCLRSLEVANECGHDLLAAEALNSLGVMDLKVGSLATARENLLQALERGAEHRRLKASVEQNLGILANIQGEYEEALSRYRRSLEAYDASRDEHGCALAYHNLGMVSADRGQYDKAQSYFRESRTIAERLGDRHLMATSLVNEAEVDVFRQRYENARQNAEGAIALFEQLGMHGAKADAYRVIGMVYRESGRPLLAESRLKGAIKLAVAASSVLNEAEACRELAVLYQGMSKNVEALELLNRAYRLFRRLDARTELVHVGGRMAEIQGTYLAVVRNWGESLEGTDSFTFGHSGRVARHAVAMARVLKLSEHDETTLLMGAYLHDVGLVQVPHEILTKPGPLSHEEREIVERHPLTGVELLANVEFPWDIKPIIRWHHEKYDGSGYPDGLRGEEIPLFAQIVSIAEVFDALTNARSGQPAQPVDRALKRVTELRAWWSERVLTAFLESLDEPPSA